MAVKFQGGKAIEVKPQGKFTYTPESFWSEQGRRFNLAWVTPADRAKAQQMRAQAKAQYDQLLKTLESIPRTDQFEELVDLIRILRERRGHIQ